MTDSPADAPAGGPQTALGEAFGAEALRAVERAGALAQFERLASRLGLVQR
jgi:hypothetical protein